MRDQRRELIQQDNYNNVVYRCIHTWHLRTKEDKAGWTWIIDLTTSSCLKTPSPTQLSQRATWIQLSTLQTIATGGWQTGSIYVWIVDTLYERMILTPDRIKQNRVRYHHDTQNSAQLKTDWSFGSRTFHLLISDSIWPRVTEKQRVKTDKGTALWLLSEMDRYSLERALKLEKTSLFFP